MSSNDSELGHVSALTLRLTSAYLARNHERAQDTRSVRFPPTQPALGESQQFLLVAPVLLFSMVAHEYAHGYAALKQGDPTAQQLGRLTWNPIKHIDPFMTILMPVMTVLGIERRSSSAAPSRCR